MQFDSPSVLYLVSELAMSSPSILRRPKAPSSNWLITPIGVTTVAQVKSGPSAYAKRGAD
jgi:hypothetical protein